MFINLPFILLFLLCPIVSFAEQLIFSDDFRGWEGDFADYPVHEEQFYELAWGVENLPTAISQGGKLLKRGLFLAGNNHSDDLFMFVRRKIEGLKPNALYELSFSILIETNVAADSFGIGGSPGESVYFKVGAASEKPRKILVNGFYQLNLDKGNQSQGGTDAITIGDLANSKVDPNNPKYLPKQLHSPRLFARSDHLGQIWIFLGTDSGFEGLTKFYIAYVAVNYKLSEDKAQKRQRQR